MLSLSARHAGGALQTLTASVVNELSPVRCAANPLLKKKTPGTVRIPAGRGLSQ